MNIQKRKRIFKGVILSLVLCALIISTLSPAAFAASSAYGYAVVNVSILNVRTGPGTDYDIAYALTTGDIVYLTGQIGEGDGYTWYELTGGNGYWIADTGGWALHVGGVYEDTINAYSATGVNVWSHTCHGSTPDWSYDFEVYNDGYYVRCTNCGWWTRRTIPYAYDDNGQPIARFIGLDTDNDERVDLFSGQSKRISCRADGSLRQYQILEFFDSLEKDTPTVTLLFGDADGELIASYTFDWWVDVYVEAYGVRMVGADESEIILPVEYDFMLQDLTTDVYLGDVGARYKHGDLGLTELFTGEKIGWHVEYGLTLAPVGEGNIPLFEWIIYQVRNISDVVTNIFDSFFGLFYIFTDEDSPFAFLIGG